MGKALPDHQARYDSKFLAEARRDGGCISKRNPCSLFGGRNKFERLGTNPSSSSSNRPHQVQGSLDQILINYQNYLTYWKNKILFIFRFVVVVVVLYLLIFDNLSDLSSCL